MSWKVFVGLVMMAGMFTSAVGAIWSVFVYTPVPIAFMFTGAIVFMIGWALPTKI